MQRSDVTVDEYIVQLQKMAKTVDLQDENHIRYAFLKGLRPQKSQGHLTRILSYIDAMIPPWAVHDHRQIKRGLGSGIGSWISWTFGLAKQSDMDKVTQNVRHIAYNMNAALNSWHKISDDMRSYTVLNDARVSNLAHAVNDTKKSFQRWNVT